MAISAPAALHAWRLLQESLPTLIWITSTMDTVRNMHPKTDAHTDNISIENLTTLLQGFLKSSSWQMVTWILSALATRLDNRKQAKDTTSFTTSRFAFPTSASHSVRFSRLRSPWRAMDNPTKTASVKSEFTFTRSSNAFWWISRTFCNGSLSSVEVEASRSRVAL